VNTATARRLAFGDRVVWIAKDGYQPAGLGTITRVAAHELEVSWDGERVIRYRRAQLYNLRHANKIGLPPMSVQMSDLAGIVNEMPRSAP
jgi:hypothetical protein